MNKSLKELIVRLLQRTPEIEEHVDITTALATSPYWTCPADGIVVMRVVSAGGANGYYIRDDTTGIKLGIYSNTSYVNTTRCSTMPVIKGHVYKQGYYAGQSRNAYYYQFK